MYLRVEGLQFLDVLKNKRSLTHPRIMLKLHGSSCECVWLRSVTQHIKVARVLRTIDDPITLYEDNDTCGLQIKEGFAKSNITKHIPPKFFSFTRARKEQYCQYPIYSFPRELIRSSDKSTSYSHFQKT